MSFLNFRHARRKAKKIVSVRSPRPPTPPTPGSFVSTAIVEIGDPSRPSAEAYYAPLTLQVDTSFAAEPLLPSEPFLSAFRESSLTANPRQSRDRHSRARSRRSGSSPKSPHVGPGSVQSKDGRFPELRVVEDTTRLSQTSGSRRVTKAPPAPIKIPTALHVPKVQVQRSAGKSAELRPASTKSGVSPVIDDRSSVVSGTTLPGALIANVWAIQTDQLPQPQSPRITRTDSAILPVGDNPFTKSPTRKHSGISNGDGESLIPPIPPLPAGVNSPVAGRPTSGQGKGNVTSDDNAQATGGSNSREQLLLEATNFESVGSTSKSLQISPISELTSPGTSDTGTPDLIKDSSTSPGGTSSDAQLDSSSNSASSAWLGPASSASPASGDELIMALSVFPAPPSDLEPRAEVSRTSVLTNERNLDEATSSRTQLAGQHRTGTTPEARRRAHSRSSSRPSLASVNTLILHPATLLPIGERRISPSPSRSLNESSEGIQEVAPDNDDGLSALPSILSATRSQHVSRLPSFPESASHSSVLRSSGFPSFLISSPPSPDLLDHFGLADESILRHQRSSSHESTSTVPTSGNRQTFPETPSVFSPMFSPGIDHSRPHTMTFPDSSTRRHPSSAKSLRGGSRASQRFIVGRSTSTKSPIRTKAHKKSSNSKLRRSSPCTSTPSIPSSLPTVAKGDVPPMSDRVRHGDGLPRRPLSVAGDKSTDVRYPQRLAHQRHSEPRRQTIILPASLVLPPPPPSHPPSPQRSASESPSSPASPSYFLLSPRPPPPKLHPPPRPVSRVSPVSPSFSQYPKAPRQPPPALLLPDAPPAADFRARPSRRSRSLSSLPSPLLPSTSPTLPLAALAAFPAHSSIDLPLNAYNTDRPRRPLGPRAPYRNASSSPKSRDRFLPSPSRQSSSRMTLMGARSLGSRGQSTFSASSSGPKFQTSPPKYKGLTFEAAKWTFSREELQGIVSQAIMHSGKSSSIRLFSQQAAFVEVPDELEKLNELLHELKVQYRLQVRKRDVLLRAIYAYAESPEFSLIAHRSKVQELHETVVNLDRIAEELYCLRDEAAQLSQMLAVHSGSALAVALRKLHSSFLKQNAELHSLKDRVYDLESERDEAWTQAQQAAEDLNELNATLQAQDISLPVTRASSRRSSRIIASRKSYLHMSRAGLSLSRRTSLAASQVGSVRSSCTSAVYAPSPTCDPVPPVPPVPPIPRRPPSLNCIIPSDLLSPNSGSMSDLSTSSARRALTRAEADLYGYLGIDDPELMPPPPRRSSIAASPSTMSPITRDLASRRMSDITDWRMTRGYDPSDRLQSFMENEPDALLNTFNHLDH